MGVAAGLVVLLLARAVEVTRRPSRRRVRGATFGSSAARWRRRSLRRPRRAPLSDPAPLLRFRTAIERGASTAQAFESVAEGGGPWAEGAARLVRRLRTGAGVQQAVDAWVDEDGDPARGLLADALAISSATGGSHLRAVDAVIDAVRDRAALEREVRALASQAEASAVVLVLLPVGFALAVAAFDPRLRAFYLGLPLGPACIAGGLVLDACGAFVMLRLVRAVS